MAGSTGHPKGAPVDAMMGRLPWKVLFTNDPFSNFRCGRDLPITHSREVRRNCVTQEMTRFHVWFESVNVTLLSGPGEESSARGYLLRIASHHSSAHSDSGKYYLTDFSFARCPDILGWNEASCRHRRYPHPQYSAA